MIGEVVDKVNGTEVKNMKHLAKLVSGVESGELTIDFKVSKGAHSRSYVVFDAAEAKAVEAEILGLNKINHWCSPELLE